MKYFVTGATGFIGEYVARQLVGAGHGVIALVRSPHKAQALADLGVSLHQGDITDKDSMRAPMTGVDGVFHIAAWYEIGRTDPERMHKINIDGTRHVLELMHELAIPKGVYTSTVGVFSDTHGKIVDETYRHDGPFLNEYERTKWIAHYEIAEPMIKDGLPLVIVMPGAVYGPGDHSLVHDQIIQFLKGRLYVAPQKTAFCWAHVEDTARGHLLAMEKGVPGESYIIGGQVATYLEMLKIGQELTGKRGPMLTLSPGVLRLLSRIMAPIERVLPVPAAYTSVVLRTTAGVTYTASNEKARRELGFSPRSLRDGLWETAQHEMQQLGMTLDT
ncbi:MAG: NAD-dependent epimerase/dehydratase family protein [Anaerolineae bacterium]|nr:NAD-dependent epimerase/dehydratase family protein [Anaerolineae bacterium]